jgi:fructose/tagatose bisphosphate aldolase
VHGAISKAGKDKKKPEARLSLERLAELRAATNAPIVLHGGSGIKRECVQDGIRDGIAKINVATAIRQPYERALATSLEAARKAVYDATVESVTVELAVAGSASKMNI